MKRYSGALPTLSINDLKTYSAGTVVRIKKKKTCILALDSKLDPPLMALHVVASGISSRAWYGAPVAEFLQSDPKIIVGTLATNCGYSLLSSQTDAWHSQIRILQSCLDGIGGSIFFEFNIPRMGRRIDVVLISGSVIFVLEFKVGEESFLRSAIDQVWDYALDLKNFHEASHHATIVPMLVATKVHERAPITPMPDIDGVYRPILVAVSEIRIAIEMLIGKLGGNTIDERRWLDSAYHPTPTIVEAARALYAEHSVESIARHDAGAMNLKLTSKRIEEIIDEARNKRLKVICFVTGVPGAGKTLVGLNVATQRREAGQVTHAVFLSGNGPLVAVLREALTRDEVARRKAKGESPRKNKVGESVKAFIQNVHHFRDEALLHPGPPIDHVVIFDEAQRAWNMQQTSKFMQRKRNYSGFAQSEPEFLINYMDRHVDWAVIVCLVGGGQEINTGEAGIDAWISAVISYFPSWEMYISSRLTDNEYAAGSSMHAARARSNTRFDECLHLSVSMRSFRAENVSAFVKSLLDCDSCKAKQAFQSIEMKYPIVLTRDLNRAKLWLKAQARGTERFGLVASSRAHRLKPHAIDIRVLIDPVHWFLNNKEDTRSSYYLEDAATEFQVQGLELDWACITWDGDFRFNGSGWSYHEFRGHRWQNVSNPDNRRYLCNAYRVLLTRARQGMVIFVPPGDEDDATRSPAHYDSTYKYLAELGIQELV